MAPVNLNSSTFKIVLCIVVSLIAIDVCCAKSLVSPNQTTPSSKSTSAHAYTTKRAYTCKCDDNPEPICANNGVTYPNKCRFDCAAHKLNGLRIVKEGDCGKYLSKLQYWSFGK